MRHIFFFFKQVANPSIFTTFTLPTQNWVYLHDLNNEQKVFPALYNKYTISFAERFFFLERNLCTKMLQLSMDQRMKRKMTTMIIEDDIEIGKSVIMNKK